MLCDLTSQFYDNYHVNSCFSMHSGDPRSSYGREIVRLERSTIRSTTSLLLAVLYNVVN